MMRELAGKRYKITINDGFLHEKDPETRRERWRYEEIRGRRGVVYMYSARQPAVTFRSMSVAHLFENRGWRVVQEGETERTVLFPAEAASGVLAAIRADRRKPRKRAP